MSYPARKRYNKRQELTPDQWSELFRVYQEGHSVTTCATLFCIGHAVVSERLKEVGLYRPVKRCGQKSAKLRSKVIPKGKFADLYK